DDLLERPRVIGPAGGAADDAFRRRVVVAEKRAIRTRKCGRADRAAPEKNKAPPHAGEGRVSPRNRSSEPLALCGSLRAWAPRASMRRDRRRACPSAPGPARRGDPALVRYARLEHPVPLRSRRG